MGPLRVLSVREAAEALAAFNAQVALQQALSPGHPPRLNGWHQQFPWAYALAAAPALVERIEMILGAPCCIWASEFWAKAPFSRMDVPWHQDDVFWPSPNGGTFSAWIALTEASPTNGGLALVPGSHRKKWEHQPVDSALGGLDQGVPPELIPQEAIFAPTLSPGEALLFDERSLHASPPNPSARPRVAFSVRYTRDPSPERGLPGPRLPPILQGWTR
ncbi:MAG: phytanoyl-CoA dioxygenase family protein [Myxococcaceae bacterium]|nr:phytanoyl-CoA dioxygenase family protein [Myxococcaceae bacterium]